MGCQDTSTNAAETLNSYQVSFEGDKSQCQHKYMEVGNNTGDTEQMG